MRINFTNENGVDAGALHREWFMLLGEHIPNETLGLLVCTNEQDRSYYLNCEASSPDQLQYFHGLGRWMGRCILEGATIGFHLSVPLLKILLGVPVSFSDLEHHDPVLYKNLLWILENDGVEDLGLNFTVCVPMVGSGYECNNMKEVELIPRGSDTSVTDENKGDFVMRQFEFALFESVNRQLRAVVSGFYDVVPPSLLFLFDYEELDFVLCGSDVIDVDDWEEHTVVLPDLQGSRVVKWFWEIVRGMSNEYRKRLLQFATGCARVPLVGFKGLTSNDGRVCLFTLRGIPYVKSDPYVRSRACFNRLELPKYRSKKILQKMIFAALDASQYGFTTE